MHKCLLLRVGSISFPAIDCIHSCSRLLTPSLRRFQSLSLSIPVTVSPGNIRTVQAPTDTAVGVLWDGRWSHILISNWACRSSDDIPLPLIVRTVIRCEETRKRDRGKENRRRTEVVPPRRISRTVSIWICVGLFSRAYMHAQTRARANIYSCEFGYVKSSYRETSSRPASSDVDSDLYSPTDTETDTGIVRMPVGSIAAQWRISGCIRRIVFE